MVTSRSALCGPHFIRITCELEHAFFRVCICAVLCYNLCVINIC
jgi:hypothetical protein